MHIKKLLVLFSFLIISLTNFATPKKVLFIGNSFTSVNNLAQVTQDLCNSLNDSITATAYAPGGQTAMGHWNDANVQTIIAQGGWDFVVIQCQSQEPSFPPSQVATDTYPYVQKLDSLIQASNTCAETVFFMTWGWQNGDATNGASYPPIATYSGMQQRLRESYLLFAQDFSATVSPVGVAWKKVRDTYPSINLYASDGVHPSMNGTYLAACTFYATFFHKSSIGSNYLAGITSTDATTLQTIASNTVLDSIENWQQYGTLPLSKFSQTITNNSVVFSNLSQRFNTLSWNFGDGNTSTTNNPTHVYSASGTYTVCLKAISNCGKIDSVCKAITVVKPNGVNDIEQENKYFTNLHESLLFTDNAIGYTYTLFSVNGEKIASQLINKNESYNISKLPKGIYFLQLSNNKNVLKFKINN